MNNFMCQALSQDGEEHGPGVMKPQSLLKHTFLTFAISLAERQRGPRLKVEKQTHEETRAWRGRTCVC